MDYPNEEWQHKGATPSDKTARQGAVRGADR